MKVRCSNFELLRIISMFMVLMIHANMVSLVKPTVSDFNENYMSVLTRYIIESLGIICVNVFVMISGWFTIKARLSSAMSFLFQVSFIWGGGYLIMLLLRYADFSVTNILQCFAFTRWDWFIKAYLVLMILAPILNIWLEKSTPRQQINLLIFFFLFQSTYGWIGGADRFFLQGYTPLSFIGLYLLSNYANLAKNAIDKTNIPYNKLFTFDKKIDFLIFITTSALTFIMGIVDLKYFGCHFNKIYAYDNPLVIVGALYFMLFFSKLNIKTNTVINNIAAGSFAVYLLHSQKDLRKVFTDIVQYLYDNYNGIVCIFVITIFLTMVFMLSIFVDRIRLLVWNNFLQKYGV